MFIRLPEPTVRWLNVSGISMIILLRSTAWWIALNDDKAIEQAPDLVASIRERLCLVYSAIDDKQQSDYNRNIYLDLQDRSRQDRQLEARAAALDENAQQLNLMIAAVVAMIVLVVVLLYVFDHMKRKKMKNQSMDKLLAPLREWSENNTKKINELKDKQEKVPDELKVTRLHIEENKKRNLEQRANSFARKQYYAFHRPHDSRGKPTLRRGRKR